MQELLFLFQKFIEEYVKQYQLAQFVYSVSFFLGAVLCILTLIKSIKYVMKVEDSEYHLYSDYYFSVVLAILSFSGFLFAVVKMIMHFVNMLSPLPGILHF